MEHFDYFAWPNKLREDQMFFFIKTRFILKNYRLKPLHFLIMGIF
jgi:hypothetical protein